MPAVAKLKVGARKSKHLTILPISIVKSYFSVVFFCLCSNLSIEPDRLKIVPNGSRFHVSIFGGLVIIHVIFRHLLNARRKRSLLH